MMGGSTAAPTNPPPPPSSSSPFPSPPLQFKKFVFELGVPINPIAIKYNKVFVEGYWNSRQESFSKHLFRIMTSWAMVVDVWFLDPVTANPGESGAAFAERVQRMIAARAGLKAVNWDGYMKYWKPSPKFISKRQKSLADDLLGANVTGGGGSSPRLGGSQPSTRHQSLSEGTGGVGGMVGAGGGGGGGNGGAAGVGGSGSLGSSRTVSFEVGGGGP